MAHCLFPLLASGSMWAEVILSLLTLYLAQSMLLVLNKYLAGKEWGHVP